MIAEQMRKLFIYNQWAWQHVYASVEKLSDDGYRRRQSLFGASTVHEVLVHCLAAESIWLDRCHGKSPTSLFDPTDYADFAAVLTHWRGITNQWTLFLQEHHDEDYQQLVEYSTTRGDNYAQPLMQILQHVINHATEHRSQLTPWLYDWGVPTPPLDYVLFLRRP